MRIAIDVDGILRDFVGKLEQVFDREYDCNGRREPITKYGIHEFFSVDNDYGKFDIYDFAFKENAREIFLRAKPYPGAMRFMDKLFKDHTVIIATAQSNTNLIMYTTEWLDLHSIPYHEFYATLNGNKSIDADMLLDDYTKNLVDFEHGTIFEFDRPVRQPICMDRPWNQDWIGDRIKTFEEFFKYVE